MVNEADRAKSSEISFIFGSRSSGGRGIDLPLASQLALPFFGGSLVKGLRHLPASSRDIINCFHRWRAEVFSWASVIAFFKVLW
jgi:hypothetical protein